MPRAPWGNETKRIHRPLRVAFLPSSSTHETSLSFPVLRKRLLDNIGASNSCRARGLVGCRVHVVCKLPFGNDRLDASYNSIADTRRRSFVEADGIRAHRGVGDTCQVTTLSVWHAHIVDSKRARNSRHVTEAGSCHNRVGFRPRAIDQVLENRETEPPARHARSAHTRRTRAIQVRRVNDSGNGTK